MVLSMVKGLMKEHGGRAIWYKGPSVAPTARRVGGACNRPAASKSSSCSWLSTSAAMHKQVHHLAAVHGIAACNHGSRRHANCYTSLSSHAGPCPSLHHHNHAGLTLQQLQPWSHSQPHSLGSCHPLGLLQQAHQTQVGYQHETIPGLGSSHPHAAAAPVDAAADSLLQPPDWSAAAAVSPTLQHQQHCLQQRRFGAAQQPLPMHAGGGQVSYAAARHVSRGLSPPRDEYAAHARHAATAALSVRGSNDYGASSSSTTPSSWLNKRPVDMTPDEKRELLLEKLAEEWGEVPAGLHEGNQRPLCPACQNGSKGEDCFSVTFNDDSILWHCFRATCGYSGGVYIYGGRDGSSSSAEAAAGAAAEAMQLRGTTGRGMFSSGIDPGVAQWQQQQQKLLHAKKSAPIGFGADLQDITPDTEAGRTFLDWFERRGIRPETLQRCGVKMAVRHCEALGGKVPHIAFPYRRNGAIVNVKYRALEKHFIQEKGGEQIFYGYDDAKGADEVIIVEGEMDKLAVEEALAHGEALGDTTRRAVLSVPAGAPSERFVGAPRNLERKFSFLHACSDILHSAKHVTLAVDNDGPGVVLADELARRIGREKCKCVTWPTAQHGGERTQPAGTVAPEAGAAAASTHTDAAGAADLRVDGDGTAAAAAASAASVPDAGSNGTGPAAPEVACKDANEVLMKCGAQKLWDCILLADPLPIRGLFKFQDFWPQIYDLYQQGPRGLSWGVSSGWESVDEYYKVVPGELTIVTGLANSGKSEWLDALAVNLARQHNWRIALCSMENSAREHGRKLMEKYTGKAFLNAAYSINTAKMEFREVVDALTWIDTHFHIIRPPADQLPSIDYILDKARAAVLRYGIQGLIIDPYNELDHRRPSTFSETEHVSRLLTKIKRFAQHYDCHVWFVAHPRTQRGLGVGGGTATLSAPTMYDISGSANFINKADNGIVVHRPFTGGQGDPCEVQLLVRKVRNKLAGKIGDVTLRYDRATGCYL